MVIGINGFSVRLLVVMVGIVLVSHSRPLAVAAQELVRAMTGPGLPLAIAAGAGENHAELGTDAVEISEAILSVKGPEGVLVLKRWRSLLPALPLALKAPSIITACGRRPTWLITGMPRWVR